MRPVCQCSSKVRGNIRKACISDRLYRNSLRKTLDIINTGENAHFVVPLDAVRRYEELNGTVPPSTSKGVPLVKPPPRGPLRAWQDGDARRLCLSQRLISLG